MNKHSALNLIAACALFVWATGTFAQQNAGAMHSHGASSGASVPTSPYAGQQTREIKALSRAQTEDLLSGKGMEQAKAAELNGYPGPMHTLELARQLELSPAQQRQTEDLLMQHKAEARALGAQLVEAERQLDVAFAAHQINAADLNLVTQKIGQLQAALRNAHLKTHLQQSALLTSEQVGRYAQLRGYSDASEAGLPKSDLPSPHQH